jgi:hypothetical protein
VVASLGDKKKGFVIYTFAFFLEGPHFIVSDISAKDPAVKVDDY